MLVVDSSLFKFVSLIQDLWPMSLGQVEWRACGNGQTAPKPSIYKAPTYNLQNYYGNPKKKNAPTDEKINVCNTKGFDS
jgi:hypothetical protein